MKRKGYTLVELLAVIAIIGILTVLIVPSANKIIRERKTKLYDSQINEIINVAKQYMINNTERYQDIDMYGHIYVPLNQLCSERYISCPITDPRDNSSMEGLVRISVENDDYIYRYYNEVVGIVLNVELNGGETEQEFREGYAEGDTVELQDPTKSGNIFLRWEVVSGDSSLNDGVLTMGSRDTTIYAMWETLPSLTVNLDGGTLAQELEAGYRSGTVVSLGTPQKSGKSFAGWVLVEGNSILSGNTLTMGTADTKIKATYTSCAAGTYNDGTSSSCIACQVGQYSDAGARHCSSCPGNMTSSEGAAGITQCRITCSAGQYLDAGGSICIPCPAGSYCIGGTFNYNAEEIQGITGACPENTYNSSAGGTSASSCIACGGDMTSVAGSTDITQCKITCAAGNYLAASGTSCSSCPAGKYCVGGIEYSYNANSNQGITGNCKANTYSTGGASANTCTACPSGMTSTAGSTAKSSCKVTCEGGTYLKANASACESCPAGKYCTGGTFGFNASSDQGITGTCPTGSYSDGGATTSSCTPCAAGTYRASTGGTSSSSCTACAKGSYSSAGSSGCTACAAGKTTSGTGSTSSSSCTACSQTNVSTWKAQSWSANSVTNLCTINACASGYTIVSNTCVDSPYNSYHCSNASAGSSPYMLNYTGNCTMSGNATNWVIKFTTGGTLTLAASKKLDIFVVGGGGGGSYGYNNPSTCWTGGGGGGGGGYHQTVVSTLSANTSYTITIGAGGTTGAKSYDADGNSGGATSVKNGSTSIASANGGAGGVADHSGQAGGTGKGGKGVSLCSGAVSNGSNKNGGAGVYAFASSGTDGIKYGAGGGGGGSADNYGTGGTTGGGAGGHNGSGSAATANTGSGGGGGGDKHCDSGCNNTNTGQAGGKGAAGAVLMRPYKTVTVTVTFHRNTSTSDTATVTESFTSGVSGNKFGYKTDGTGRYSTMSTNGFGNWTRSGYTFLGWNKSSTATTAQYSAYNGVNNNWIFDNASSVDLYGVWEKN